ncbi:MAG: hypothetical protein IPO27_18395 [Bacteroidetes bacterium]|nr:hypothetical protein [Bacteroidota bacterium]
MKKIKIINLLLFLVGLLFGFGSVAQPTDSCKNQIKKYNTLPGGLNSTIITNYLKCMGELELEQKKLNKEILSFETELKAKKARQAALKQERKKDDKIKNDLKAIQVEKSKIENNLSPLKKQLANGNNILVSSYKKIITYYSDEDNMTEKNVYENKLKAIEKN